LYVLLADVRKLETIIGCRIAVTEFLTTHGGVACSGTVAHVATRNCQGNARRPWKNSSANCHIALRLPNWPRH